MPIKLLDWLIRKPKAPRLAVDATDHQVWEMPDGSRLMVRAEMQDCSPHCCGFATLFSELSREGK